MKRVLLAGEGKTELGEWAKEPPFRVLPGDRGVLAALIERVDREAFTLVGGIPWKNIRKYKAGDHASAEERNVLGLVLSARRARCDTVVFSRDQDGSVTRREDLEKGIRRAADDMPDITVIGGAAVENIEGWVLVILGFTDGEGIPSKRTKEELETRSGIVTLQQKVDAVDAARLHSFREGSLGVFLDRARGAFAKVGDAPYPTR
jgi:hypothetical protein